MQKRLPGLDFLRFYAALSVVIYHTNSFGGWLTTGADYQREAWTRVFLPGWDAVTLFFVLSGFLITHLLLAEHNQHGAIDVKRFYLRRALRIWPLYYLVLLLSLPVLAHFPAPAIALMSVFLTNVVTLCFPMLILGHLWSIAAEEQFYLLWPLVLRATRNNVPRVAFVAIAGKLTILGLLYLRQTGTQDVTLDRMIQFLLAFRFEAMMLGALGAWLAHRQHHSLRFLYSRAAQGCTLACCLLIIVSDHEPSAVIDLAVACVFGALIVNVATNPRALFRLEFRHAQTLGSLSYAMYALHMLAITAVFLFGGRGLMLYLGAVGLTLAAAAVSGRYFERPFLRLKDSQAQPRMPQPVAGTRAVMSRPS